MKKLLFPTLVAFAVLFSSCGKYGELSKNLAKGANGPATVLQGAWSTGCTSISGYAYTKDIVFDGSFFQITEKLYSDQCRTPIQTAVNTGNFALKGPASGANQKIDFTYTQQDGSTQTIYNIFLLQGAQLYFGTGADGTSDATRPSQVDMSMGLSRR